MHATSIRMWKIAPRKTRLGMQNISKSPESTTEKFVPKYKSVAPAVASRRGDFSPTVRSSQRSHSEDAEHDHEEEKEDASEAIKRFLESGKHKNDPRKIAETIARIKASNGRKGVDEGKVQGAKSIAERNGGGKARNSGGWRPQSAREPEREEVEEEEEEEREEAQPETKIKTYKVKTWKPDGSYSGGRGDDRKGSSSYYSKFAKENLGGSFRRPAVKPDDEAAEIAKSIFSKYAKKGKKEEREKPALPSTSFGSTRNKINRDTTAAPPTESSKIPSRQYTPKSKRPSNGGGGNQFWPTPRPFKPKRKMTSRTTMSTARSTTTATRRIISTTEAPPTEEEATLITVKATQESPTSMTTGAEASASSRLDTSR